VSLVPRSEIYAPLASQAPANPIAPTARAARLAVAWAALTLGAFAFGCGSSDKPPTDPGDPDGGGSDLVVEGLSARSVPAGVELRWTEESEATGYRIHWATTAGVDSTDASITVGEVDRTVHAVAAGPRYFYRIAALEGTEVGVLSEEVSAIAGLPTDPGTTPNMDFRYIDSGGICAAWGNDLWVVAGPAGYVLVSEDGIVWDRIDHGLAITVQDLVYTGEEFVAVGTGVMTSPDGTTWTNRLASTAFRSAVWTGKEVHASNGSSIWASPDGHAWAQVASVNVTKLVWNGVRLLGEATGLFAGERTLTSDDFGRTWTQSDRLDLAMTNAWTVWDQDHWVRWKGLEIGTSPNGLDWTLQNTTKNWIHPGGSEFISGLLRAENGFVALGTRTTNGISQQRGVILTSQDGLVWDEVPTSDHELLRGLARGEHDYLAVGTAMLHSDDALAWDLVSAGTWNHQRIQWSAGQFVITESGSAILATSDARIWHRYEFPSGTDILSPVALFTGTRYIVTGEGGRILTSEDGAAWTSRVSGTSLRINDLARRASLAGSPELVVGVGQEGVVITSPDGATWNASFPLTESLIDVEIGDSLIVAIGVSKAITSVDGVTWTVSDHGVLSAERLVWTGTEFFVWGDRDIARSPDGVVWSAAGSLEDQEPAIDPGSIVWIDGSFAGYVDFGNRLVQSENGVVWRTTQEIGSEGGGEELAWNGSELVVLATRLAIGRKVPGGLAIGR